MNTQKRTLLCIGDSIVNGYPYTRRASWPFWLERVLQAEGLLVEVINEGVNGESSGELLKRLSSEVKAARPDQVIISSGTNDFIFTALNAGQVFSNLKAMYEEVKEQGAKPVAVTPILTIPNIASRCWTEGTDYIEVNKHLEELGETIKQHCQANVMACIDMQGSYRGLCEKLGPASCYVDGIHPTDMGYRMMTEMVKESLTKG